MKKHILLALALSFGLAACTGDYTDWADPQHNDPEAMQTTGLTVTPVAPVVYANLAEGVTSVPVFNATVSAELGAASRYTITFPNGTVLDATENGEVNAKELSDVVANIYGKAPEARVMNCLVTAYIDINGQVVKRVGQVDVNVTLDAPNIDAGGYYLIGDLNKWGKEPLLKFNHSDANVFDDPVFTLSFETTEDNSYWKIIPQSNVTAGDTWAVGVLGTAIDGDASLTGLLTADNPQAGKIELAGKYKMTLNMMEGTYTIEPILFEKWLFIPGDHQGDWDPASAPRLYSEAQDGIYVGFTYLNSQFKFTKYGNWSDEYNYSSFSSYSDIFSGEGTGNIVCSTPGYYRLTADLMTGSLTAEVMNWGVIGSATPGGWDNDTDMTWDAKKKCLTATLDLTADKFKFRANDAWKVDLGGDMNNLSFGGADIAVAEAGTYVVDLYIDYSNGHDNYYCVLTKK